jgi:hypothetical protein
MMAKHGDAEGRALLEKRLRQWRDNWSGHESLWSGNEQRLEMELVSALNHAKAWTFSTAELESLRQGTPDTRVKLSVLLLPSRVAPEPAARLVPALLQELRADAGPASLETVGQELDKPDRVRE